MSRTVTKETSSNGEKTWPVRLYRYTESEGWQQQINPDTVAAPRKDCVVIPTFRQKFTLCCYSDGNNSNGGGSSGNGVVVEKSYVIRREKCLLLVSRRRTRAMVLEFESLASCLEFSDRFLELNPDLAYQQPTATTMTTMTDDDDNNNNIQSQGNKEGSHQQVTTEQRRPTLGPSLDQREEVISYVARLLHDNDFLGFVGKLEQYLSSTEDGSQILNRFAQQLPSWAQPSGRKA